MYLHEATREIRMISDEVLGEELKDDMVDVAHVDSVDDRLAQGIPKKTLVLGNAVAWRVPTCTWCTRKSEWQSAS